MLPNCSVSVQGTICIIAFGSSTRHHISVHAAYAPSPASRESPDDVGHHEHLSTRLQARQCCCGCSHSQPLIIRIPHDLYARLTTAGAKCRHSCLPIGSLQAEQFYILQD